MAEGGSMTGIMGGPKLDWRDDNGLHTRYKAWKRTAKTLFGGPMAKLSESEKCYSLRYWSGETGMQLVEKWYVEGKLQEPDGDGNVPDGVLKDDKLESYWTLFERHIAPRTNGLIAAVELKRLVQGNDSFESFHTKAVMLADEAEFKPCCKDRIIRDTLVGGMSHRETLKKIVKEGNKIELPKVLDIVRTELATSRQTTQLVSNASTVSINAATYDRRQKQRSQPKGQQNAKQKTSHRNTGKSSGTMETCYRCGRYKHAEGKTCYATHQNCRNCNKKGHYERVCKSKKSTQRHDTHNIETGGTDEERDYYIDEYGQTVYVDSIAARSRFGRSKSDYLTLKAGVDIKKLDQDLQLKLDTGAEVNAIDLDTYRALFPKTPLKKADVRMRAYGGAEVAVLGRFNLFLDWKGTKYCQPFFVTRAKSSPNILSKNAIYTMGLLKPMYTVETSKRKDPQLGQDQTTLKETKNTTQATKDSDEKTNQLVFPLTKENVLKAYPDVFNGLGKFPGEAYRFSLKEDHTPARHAPRKVPIHRQQAFKDELDRLVDQGVLEPVHDQTEWVNSFVIVEKEDAKGTKLRICLDPRDLNKALKREPYHNRGIDEVFGKLHGKKIFSTVDFSKGYWMVELHPDSRKLTCMATEFGRFQWTRLPMGTSVAQDIFQRKLDGIFLNLPGVLGIADDMTITGTTEEEHDRSLIRLLDTCRRNNLKLNPDKVQFKSSQIEFFGHQWSSEGLMADPKKVSAIKIMEFPKEKETMRSFLGLVNYMNRFSAQLADVSTPLRDLTRQDTNYTPEEIHHKAFEKLKEILINTETLSYFDPKELTTLQTDASLRGLGAVLLQRGRPIMYASRALSPTESGYQNIEREALGNIWGMEKFHYFLYGKNFILETDQKPMESIYKKHLVDVSPRLQRLVLRSLPYNFEAKYIKGKDNVIADALSRVTPSQEEMENGIKLPIIAVNLITECALTEDLEEIQKAGGCDMEYSRLKDVIYRGFPNVRRQLDRNLQPYWNYRDDLSVDNGVICKGARLLIPKQLQMKYLNRIHEGHLGREKCLLRARDTVFWNGITKDVAQLVEKCSTCQVYAPQAKTTLGITSETPQHPWQVLGTDLFYWNKRDYLVVGDYFSKFLIVRRLPNSTAHAVTMELSSIITETGCPETIKSDNGPCYSSQVFKEMCSKYGIRHVTSSPHHPESNGFAESLVKISKRLMDKATEDGKLWTDALLEYRLTPLGPDIPSPMSLMYGRKPRMKLPQAPGTVGTPIAATQYRSSISKKRGENEKLRQGHINRQNDMAPGDPIYMKKPGDRRWQPGKIICPVDEPYSYRVQDSHGAEYRKTLTDLKPRQMPTAQEIERQLCDWSGDKHHSELPSLDGMAFPDEGAETEDTDAGNGVQSFIPPGIFSDVPVSSPVRRNNKSGSTSTSVTGRRVPRSRLTPITDQAKQVVRSHQGHSVSSPALRRSSRSNKGRAPNRLDL